ncbi:MAG: hypothetical protein IH948_04505 [Bacteroidetes bacterium]|nr:hypothetical protein [Bacteroidota bacterium]
MTLRYYSFPIQEQVQEKPEDSPNKNIVSIYVDCNTPLTHKREHELLDPLIASQLSEHYLAVSIIDGLVRTIGTLNNISEEERTTLSENYQYLFRTELRSDLPLFVAILMEIDRRNTIIQEDINDRTSSTFGKNLITFNNNVLPLLKLLRMTKSLEYTHFSFLIDDFQLLNKHQMRSMNSWIAYRNNEIFSFKVAITKADEITFETGGGGTILEGHDFLTIDMDKPYQNNMSAFGKHAQLIIKRRLETFDIDTPLDKFFKTHPKIVESHEKARLKAEELAHIKYPNGTAKQIEDYIYKYRRAILFRDRPGKANLPIYSGLNMLIHLSTGVIRNLLDPCYWMYDRLYSETSEEERRTTITEIPASIQDEIIQERSRKKWNYLREGIALAVPGCTTSDQLYLYQMMDNLMLMFYERLFDHKSEPRAVTITISGDLQSYPDLVHILAIARRAQILYEYTGPGKELGTKKLYYLPTRILLPSRGLDPVEQHARASIKAMSLPAAAFDNKKIPWKTKGKDEGDEAQTGDIFLTDE